MTHGIVARLTVPAILLAAFGIPAVMIPAFGVAPAVAAAQSLEKVDVRGRLLYNPGWEQQKLNLGKTYEPQQKESSFRLYYNLDTGFLAVAEGIRKIIGAYLQAAGIQWPWWPASAAS